MFAIMIVQIDGMVGTDSLNKSNNPHAECGTLNLYTLYDMRCGGFSSWSYLREIFFPAQLRGREGSRMSNGYKYFDVVQMIYTSKG